MNNHIKSENNATLLDAKQDLPMIDEQPIVESIVVNKQVKPILLHLKNKITKKIIVSLCIVLILLINVPWFTGLYIKSQFDKNIKQSILKLQQLQKLPFITSITATVIHYQRHYLNSQAQVDLTVIYNKNWQPSLLTSPFNKKETPHYVTQIIHYQYHIKHGPIIENNTFQLAKIQSIIQTDNSKLIYKADSIAKSEDYLFFDSLFSLKLPILGVELKGNSNLSQNGHFSFITHSPIQIKQQNETISLGKITIDGLLPINSTRIDDTVANNTVANNTASNNTVSNTNNNEMNTNVDHKNATTQFNINIDDYDLNINYGTFNSNTAVKQILMKSTVDWATDARPTLIKTGSTHLILNDIRTKGHNPLISQAKLQNMSIQLNINKILYGWLPLGSIDLSLDKFNNALIAFDKINYNWQLTEDNKTNLNNKIKITLQAKQLSNLYNRYSSFIGLPNTKIKFKQFNMQQNINTIPLSIFKKFNDLYQITNGFKYLTPEEFQQKVGQTSAQFWSSVIAELIKSHTNNTFSTTLSTNKGDLNFQLTGQLRENAQLSELITDSATLFLQGQISFEQWFKSIMTEPKLVLYSGHFEISSSLYEQMKQDFSEVNSIKFLIDQLDSYLLKDPNKLTYYIDINYNNNVLLLNGKPII